MKPRKIVRCQGCGEMFERSYHHVWYCSDECWKAFKKKVVCKQCGLTFKRSSSYRTLCSDLCKKESKKEKRRQSYHANKDSICRRNASTGRDKELQRLTSCRYRAVKKNIGFNLDMDFMHNLMAEKHCHYCGKDIDDSVRRHRGCVDRKDNVGGYTKDNTVYACLECNNIKGESLSYDEMIAVSKLLKDMRE